MKIWLNNMMIDEKDAKVSVLDRGFLYGDGIFETMRSYDGRVFKIDAHLDRFFRSLKIVYIQCPYTKKILKEQIYRLMRINRLSDAYIRLSITRGTGTLGLAATFVRDPSVMVIAKPHIPYPAALYRRGVKLAIAVKTRQNERSPLATVKSTNFLNYILARIEAKGKRCDDALVLNAREEVCEATVSNIFMVKGRALITPSVDCGALPGITRSVVLALAPKAGLASRQRRILPGELYRADEIFLTNSLMEVMPVALIDRRKIGEGVPGPLTKALHIEYKKEITRSANSF